MCNPILRPMRIRRRRFGGIASGALASLGFGHACRVSEDSLVGRGSSLAGEAGDGRLTARPRANVSTSAKGERLGLGGARDAILRLPANAPAAPLPLLVLLHSAGGSGEGILRRLGAAADEAGVAVLAPDSR